MWREAGVTAAALLMLSGCGGCASGRDEKGIGVVVGATSDEVQVVVIGDSLIDPANGCPAGCTGFAERFTDHIASVLGVRATYKTVATSSVPDAVEAVSKPGPEADKVAAADVVVVQVGYNNAVPDPETGIGCKTLLLDTEPECLAEGVKTYGALYDQLFAGVKRLRGDKPTVYVATTTINGNIAPIDAFPDGLLAMDRKNQSEVRTWAIAAYDRWNTMLTERAAAASFQVVDVYHAMNGPDGTQTNYPKYTADGAHLNQAGNDVVAYKLAGVDLSAIDK
jgi:lysophospholipase L1-like esterase